MKKGLRYFIALIFLIYGCSSQNTMKLNDTIVKANEELRMASEVFNKSFDSIGDNNYSLIEPERQKMITLIDDKIKMITALKANMPGGEDFRDSFVEYYKFEKDIYETDFKAICLLTGKEDTEKFNEIVFKMKEKSKKEDDMEKSIHSEQEKFARKNNLKLK